MVERLEHAGNGAAGMALWAVGTFQGIPMLQLAGLVIGAASVATAVSREVRAWLDRRGK